MPRWYMGFSCSGRPKIIVDQVAARVSMRHLGQLVPVARVERRAHGGQFYLFLAVDSPKFGEIPDEVQSGLLDLPPLAWRIPQPFTFDEIRNMVSGELDVHDYAQRLAYWRPSELPEQDPFAASGQPVAGDGAPMERVIAYDRFLQWLSAVGSGSWEMFREARRACLGDHDEGAPAARTLRQLRLLGHLEASQDGKRWCIAPTVIALASDPAEGEYAFLCGQHDPAIIAALDREAEHELLPPEDGNGPQLIRWREGTTALAAARATSAGQTGMITPEWKVALRLAQALPPIVDWASLQPGLRGIIPQLYHVKRFNGEDFTDVHFDSQSGMYEFWPLEEGPDQKVADGYPILTAFYDAPRDRWLRGDWYGLRFLARLANGEACPARYNADTYHLAVPSDWRWPELYERALVLASGRLPERTREWLIYRAITPQALEVLAQKLDLQLKED